MYSGQAFFGFPLTGGVCVGGEGFFRHIMKGTPLCKPGLYGG